MSNNNKQNWLILTQYFPPEIGAPQIRLMSMVKELEHNGINASVLTAMPNYPKGELFDGYKKKIVTKEKINGIDIKRTWVYAASGKASVPRILNYLSFTVSATIAALFGPKPDLVFVESQPLSLGLVAILMKWVRRVPYIYNIPDLQIEVAKEMDFVGNSLILKISKYLEDFFMKQSWKISTVTEAFMTHIHERGIEKNKITYLPNGADTNFLKPLFPNKKLISKWNLGNKKVFLYVGTHAFYHGLEIIIKAASILKNNKDIIFLMIGNGPERERIINMAESEHLDNIIFGESPYEEMADLYSISYCSIASLKNIQVSKQMRLSKIFPSLSCAKPVIYAGIGEAADLLNKHECGLIVEPENPIKLSETILKLAEDKTLQTKLGESGRRLVEKDYSWHTIINRWSNQINIRTSNKMDDI